VLKYPFLGVVWPLHLLLLTLFQLEVELVVTDPEAMELVEIQAFVVHSGVIVELERNIVEQHQPLEPVVMDPKAMELVKSQAFVVHSGVIVELDLPIVAQLDKVTQLQFQIHHFHHQRIQAIQPWILLIRLQNLTSCQGCHW
jgi:hypothetical protein